MSILFYESNVTFKNILNLVERDHGKKGIGDGGCRSFSQGELLSGLAEVWRGVWYPVTRHPEFVCADADRNHASVNKEKNEDGEGTSRMELLVIGRGWGEKPVRRRG